HQGRFGQTQSAGVRDLSGGEFQKAPESGDRFLLDGVVAIVRFYLWDPVVSSYPLDDERFRDVAQPPRAGFRIGTQIDVGERIIGTPVVPPNARDGSQFGAGGSGKVVNLPGRV